MSEGVLERIFSFEDVAPALNGEEGGYFRFGSFDFPGREIVVRKVRETA
jgi:hypothetical protein